MLPSACLSAKALPVIEAQRVPPSALRTSQSTRRVCSPKSRKSTIIRRDRPINRWISWVRPERPETASLRPRLLVAQGSMLYSAVIHPWPLPLRKGGTLASTVTPQSTWVLPILISTEPSALGWKPYSTLTGRRLPTGRSPLLIFPPWLDLCKIFRYTPKPDRRWCTRLQDHEGDTGIGAIKI